MFLESARPELEWHNVAVGIIFVIVNALLSHLLELEVGQSLITASVRCIIQLTLVSHLLERAFSSHDPRIALGIIVILNALAALETVTNKCKRRYKGMFIVVLCSMLFTTIPLSYIGVRFAMGVDPLSTPAKYIPIVGMLCGNTISKLQVSLAYVLQELSVNRVRTEAYLLCGASRSEACKPITQRALHLALTPSINQMSVLGIISIPGTMTGAILGGSGVGQAARLQMIAAFMLAASSSLATIIAVTCTLVICVDDEHRVRPERIYERPTTLWRMIAGAAHTLRCAVNACARKSISAFSSGKPLPNRYHVEGDRPPPESPVIALTSSHRRRISGTVQSSMLRVRSGRGQSANAVSDFLSADWRVDMLTQGLPGLRGPTLFSTTMILDPAESQRRL